jgi:hypothetical protein
VHRLQRSTVTGLLTCLPLGLSAQTDSTTDATRRMPSAAAVTRVAGHYYLEGVREVGSELLLRPDGSFDYMLAYGALDESGAGRWRTDGGAVVLQSNGVARAPSVTLRKVIGRATDSIRVIVSDTLGRPISGIEVDFVRPKGGTSFAQTQQGEYVQHFARTDAPTEISVGYDMLNFMVAFPLARPPAAEYRFIFSPGDLGIRRFEAERLEIEDGALIMTRNGRRMRYVRH